MKKLWRFWKKKKITPLFLLSRVFILILGLFLMPIEAIQADNQDIQDQAFQSSLKLDQNQSVPIVLTSKSPQIVLGESNYEKAKKEARMRYLAQRNREVITRDYERGNNDVSLEQKRALVKKAASQYSIDWKILEAVWEVESGKSWDMARRSYAGATGPMQFIPGTWRKYAVDANGDGSADIYSAEDAVYAGANLLAQAGAASGDIDSALYSYNHAQWYVNKVKRVADSIAD